jgi:transketolase
MRSIPGMVVMCPSDDVEARAAVKAAYEYKGPVYLRFGRLAVPVFHEEGMKFEIGRGEVLHDGKDVAIIATGLMTYEALEAAKALEEKGISARVINLCTIKPLDEELVLRAAAECGRVITCDEHSVIGGLGEAVCALLSEKCPTPVRRIGVNDEFGRSGTPAELMAYYHLTGADIADKAKKAIALKG